MREEQPCFWIRTVKKFNKRKRREAQEKQKRGIAEESDILDGTTTPLGWFAISKVLAVTPILHSHLHVSFATLFFLLFFIVVC